MGASEVKIFVTFMSVTGLIFIVGIISFIVQYRKKKLLFEDEKRLLQEQYKLSVLDTQIRTQQQTMKKIGAEIHDNIGQKLTLASLYAKQLTSLCVLDKYSELSTDIGSIIDESLADLRSLSKSLMMDLHIEEDLICLLQREALQLNKLYKCQMSIVSKRNQIILPSEVKNNLYRILQEFTHNSLKHSNCTQIIITISLEQDELIVIAEDNGVGFNQRNSSAGIGLRTMEERAEQLNALFSFQSAVGLGTRLTCRFSTKFYNG